MLRKLYDIAKEGIHKATVILVTGVVEDDTVKESFESPDNGVSSSEIDSIESSNDGDFIIPTPDVSSCIEEESEKLQEAASKLDNIELGYLFRLDKSIEREISQHVQE